MNMTLPMRFAVFDEDSDDACKADFDCFNNVIEHNFTMIKTSIEGKSIKIKNIDCLHLVSNIN